MIKETIEPVHTVLYLGIITCASRSPQCGECIPGQECHYEDGGPDRGSRERGGSGGGLVIVVVAPQGEATLLLKLTYRRSRMEKAEEGLSQGEGGRSHGRQQEQDEHGKEKL